MRCLPNFIIIGAMKSATTTLHEQLARQPGIGMSRPKEPNFFSDDDNYAQGLEWYLSAFAEVYEQPLRGESSTHYTKLPTFPQTVARMSSALPDVKLIYVMRHPIDRLISHYVHEITNGRISSGIHDAIDTLPELTQYGLYARQLTPYLRTYGPRNILPVFFERLVHQPQAELERICAFLGYPGKPHWNEELKPQNVGSERLRHSVLRDVLVRAPVLSTIRRRVVPKPLADSIKSIWRTRTVRPQTSPELVERLQPVFDEDLERLGNWLGIRLNCNRFDDMTSTRPREWAPSANWA